MVVVPRLKVMPGVASEMHEVQVEGTFPDGTKLVTIHVPICKEDGDLALALQVNLSPTTTTTNTLFLPPSSPTHTCKTAEIGKSAASPQQLGTMGGSKSVVLFVKR